MRKAKVFRNGKYAGMLVEENRHSYNFTYDDLYFSDSKNPSISLTLPKHKKSFQSKFLFSFFYNMLSEGANKKLQSRHLKIDEKDHFGLLIATAKYETIGPISVEKVSNDSE